jgi:hypothetical protein
VGFCDVATCKDDGRSSFDKSSCHLVAESSVGTGDDEDFAAEILVCGDPA